MESNTGENQERDNTEAQAPLGVGDSVTPKLVSADSESSKIDALEHEFQRYRKWEFRFTFVIAFSAVLSVGVAFLQWRSMQGQLDEMGGNGKQTDALIAQVTEQAKAANELAKIANASLAESRLQFQRDQRPYVIPYITPVSPKPGAPLEGHVFMVNYGKTPALNVGSYTGAFVGPDALKQADNWFADERQNVFNTSIGGIVPPGIPANLSRMLPAVSKKKLTPEDIEVLLGKDNQAVFVARNLYFDSAGNGFSTDTCYRLLKGWVTAFCEQHNEIYEHYKDRRDSEQNAQSVPSK